MTTRYTDQFDDALEGEQDAKPSTQITPKDYCRVESPGVISGTPQPGYRSMLAPHFGETVTTLSRMEASSFMSPTKTRPKTPPQMQPFCQQQLRFPLSYLQPQQFQAKSSAGCSQNRSLLFSQQGRAPYPYQGLPGSSPDAQQRKMSQALARTFYPFGKQPPSQPSTPNMLSGPSLGRHGYIIYKGQSYPLSTPYSSPRHKYGQSYAPIMSPSSVTGPEGRSKSTKANDKRAESQFVLEAAELLNDVRNLATKTFNAAGDLCSLTPTSSPAQTALHVNELSSTDATSQALQRSSNAELGGPGRGRGWGRDQDCEQGKKAADILCNEILNEEGLATKEDLLLPYQPPRWCAGNVVLGLKEDKYWLSELQVYLRANFVEAFEATKKEIAAPLHGRNKPIVLGQVGIRCKHCRDDPATERGQQAVLYPSLVSGIYNSVQQMFRLHLVCCLAVPSDVRAKIDTLRASSSSRGGRKQYWIDAAKRLGLIDTPHGIHFGRDPYGPLPPHAGPSASPDDEAFDEEDCAIPNLDLPDVSPEKLATGVLSHEHKEEMKRQKEEAYPLVLPEDQSLISNYLYLALEQMEPCKLMDADRVGCYKGRQVGFSGLACMHCDGQAGCGRYFPASEASLSQTTTSQTILNHVQNCRRCPIEIRINLESMKRSKTRDKPKHGGRKEFFNRLWCRIQGIPIKQENVDVKVGRKKDAKNKRLLSTRTSGICRKKRRRLSNTDSDDESSEIDSDLDEAGQIDEDTSSDNSDEGTEIENDKEKNYNDSKVDSDSDGEGAVNKGLGCAVAANDEKLASVEMTSCEVNCVHNWFEACVPLKKPDGPYWLSDLQCYIRSEMIQVFTVTDEDITFGKYENLEMGQVGIRCKFCATLGIAERPKGHAYFPSSITKIHQIVKDLQRRHFSSCDEIPDDVRETLRLLHGLGAKAEGDTLQYWIDSARELGLADSSQVYGVHFFRNPCAESPSDELHKNSGKDDHVFNDKMSFVRSDDRGIATDHAYLLVRQMRPCRFKNCDRRGGPGSRGRDRAIGFPGIACRHCSNQNNSGRFFPVAAKSLGENTANSIQTHLANCPLCPEAVKASLAYLVHRSTLQKAELGASWKKSFYKRVWDRLHHERAWSKSDNVEDVRYAAEKLGESTPEEEDNNKRKDASEKKSSDNNSDDDLASEIRELVNDAAVWLTERDAEDSPIQLLQSRRGRGRGSSGRLGSFNLRGNRRR